MQSTQTLLTFQAARTCRATHLSIWALCPYLSDNLVHRMKTIVS